MFRLLSGGWHLHNPFTIMTEKNARQPLILQLSGFMHMKRVDAKAISALHSISIIFHSANELTRT